MNETADQVIEQAGSSYLRTVGASPPDRPDTFMQNRWLACGFLLALLVISVYFITRILRRMNSR